MNARHVTGRALLVAWMLSGAEAPGEELEASSENGLRLSNDDGSTTLQVGGQIQSDWVFQQGDNDLLAALGDPLEDGTRFRRIRLSTSGTVRNVAIFQVQLDFAGGTARVKDVWVGLKDLGGGVTVTVGDQYEPFGLEEQTSSKRITFLERSLTSTFTPERNSGIRAEGSSEAVTWAAGVFRESDSFGTSVGDGEYNGTGRLVIRPVRERKGRKLLHLGVAGSLRNPPSDALKYSQAPENSLAPPFVATGDLAAEAVKLLGLEAALVDGPVSVQGEYMHVDVSTLDNADPTFSAVYVMASWVATGEHRRYKSATATFDRVVPDRDFDGQGGRGAWELAARFSRVDLDDQSVAGGDLSDVTVGLNWYPNPNFRWMANWVRADLESIGVSNAFLMRFQADF